jgi:glycine cleavage system pyridoxal-binding protein P
MLIHGLSFRVNWTKFIVGASFFIPCLDTEAALAEAMKVAGRLNYKIRSRVVVNKGVYGLRIWRLK